MSEQLPLVFTTEPDTLQSMVEHFHWTYNQAVDQRTNEVLSLRRRLVREEFNELMDELLVAHKAVTVGDPIPNLGQVAKEAADVLVVVFGTAVSLGIDLEEAFRRVHASNMSKLGLDGKPILREDGKVLKGPNYFTPDMTGTYREEHDE